jgi:hypothetical protein
MIRNSIFLVEKEKIRTIVAISAWNAKYFPSDICVIKERITVRSNASETVVPKICAKVKMIVPKAPITQIVELTFKRVRIFSPDVVKNPSLLMTRNAMDNKAPTTAKPPIKLRNLNVVVKRFIDY